MILASRIVRRRTLLHPGWYALLGAVTATGMGIAAVDTVASGFATRQMRWAVLSLLALVLCLLPRPRFITRMAYPMMAVAMGALLITVLPGVPRSLVPVRNGATCWIDLKVMSVQPAELVKLTFVLAMAVYLSNRTSYRSIRGLLITFALMAVPVAILLKQPDLGTALLFGPTLLAMLLAAGAKLRHLGALAAIGVLAIVVNVMIIALDAPQWMHVLKPHQEARIASMIWPERYQKTAAFQQNVALNLVGSGQLIGYGKEQTRTLVNFNGLPEPHNDMIFAVITNRWGLVGALAILAIFQVIVGSILLVAVRTRDPVARLTCVGFAGLLLTQVAINVGVCIGLVPVTGLTLPFISYGGSSLMMSFAMIGLVINFASQRPALISRPSFEFDQRKQVASP